MALTGPGPAVLEDHNHSLKDKLANSGSIQVPEMNILFSLDVLHPMKYE